MIFFHSAIAALVLTSAHSANAEYSLRVPFYVVVEIFEVVDARISNGQLLIAVQGSPAYYSFECDLGVVSESNSSPIGQAWCEPTGQLAQIDMDQFVSMWEAADCLMDERSAARILGDVGVNNDVGGFMAHSMMQQGLAELDMSQGGYRLKTGSCH